MSEERNWFNTYIAGFFIALLIYTSMFFILEWMNKIFSSVENVNPLRLPKMHLAALIVNIILFRFLIMKDRKENTAKGVLFFSFLYTLAYFLLINK